MLVKRYKETRRNHPLAGSERINKGIVLEREKLQYLKDNADYIIDTSQLLTRELKIELEKIFVQNEDYKNLFITILSFGFKYGIPSDSDIVMDVRFCQIPTMWTDCARKPAMIRRYRTMSCSFRRQMSLSTSLMI